MKPNELFQSVLQASQDFESLSEDFLELSGNFEYTCATALSGGTEFDATLSDHHDRVAKALIAAAQRYASLARQLSAELTSSQRQEKTSA